MGLQRAGIMLAEGRGTPRNLATAVKMLLKAAEQDDDSAIMFLDHLFLRHALKPKCPCRDCMNLHRSLLEGTRGNGIHGVCTGCEVRAGDVGAMLICKGCNTARFCNEECFKTAWHAHKAECAILRKERKQWKLYREEVFGVMSTQTSKKLTPSEQEEKDRELERQYEKERESVAEEERVKLPFLPGNLGYQQMSDALHTRLQEMAPFARIKAPVSFSQRL